MKKLHIEKIMIMEMEKEINEKEPDFRDEAKVSGVVSLRYSRKSAQMQRWPHRILLTRVDRETKYHY